MAITSRICQNHSWWIRQYATTLKGRSTSNTFFEYYFTDIALRNAVLDMRQQEETHIMENGFCSNAV